MIWGQVREWDPGGLEAVVDDIQAEVEELRELADRLRYEHPATWSGEASEAAMRQRRQLLADYEEIDHTTEPVWKELHHAAQEIRKLHREQDQVDEHARQHFFTISSTGGLVDELPAGPYEDQFLREREKVKAGIAEEIRSALKEAEAIDVSIAAAMRRARDPRMYADANGHKSRLNRPPKDAPPSEIADWWKGLSESERQELISEDPKWVGSADGIPAEYRDQANRHVLDSIQENLTSKRDELQAKLDAIPLIGGGGAGESRLLREEIERIDGKLDALKAIEGKLQSTDHLPENQRNYLLGISSANEGQYIVAKGNPDTADNIATYVPGTGAGLHGQEGVNDNLTRGDRMRGVAGRAGAHNTSVITWAGYDAPQNVVTEATSQDYATDAKDDLARFQDGLRATHEQPRPSQNTLVGHSYGTVVVGHAMRDFDGAGVDKAVMVASPGTGVDHAPDLHIGADNVYAVTDSSDPIGLTPEFIHGTLPDADDYGARTFESDSGDWLISMAAHSKYWEPGNPSLRSMGNIIAGREP